MTDLPDQLIDELDAVIVQLGRLMSARHGEMCCEGALSPAQAITLRILGDHESLKMGELAGLLGIKAPAASALVDSLARAAMVEREHDVDDRRVMRVRLSEAGRAALSEAEAERRHYMRRYTSVLSEHDVRELIRIHRILIDGLMADTL